MTNEHRPVQKSKLRVNSDEVYSLGKVSMRSIPVGGILASVLGAFGFMFIPLGTVAESAERRGEGVGDVYVPRHTISSIR